MDIRKLIREKESQVCVGIDPPLELTNEQKLEFALQIIGRTSKYVVAFKPNRQYFLGFPTEWMEEITREIRNRSCVSIMDHKLSDIGSSNSAAIRHIASEGFDFFTFSPFAGNLAQAAEEAHELGIGVISLTLMSNPEAVWMTEGPYVKFAEQAEKYADGMVVGSTNHISTDHLHTIRDKAPTPFVLAPGIGFQGGSPRTLLEVFDQDVVFTSSRGIIRAEDPRTAAKELRDLVRKTRDLVS